MTEEAQPTETEEPEPTITKAESRDLWVVLDGDELESHKVDMLRAMSERDDLEDELDQLKKDHKKKLGKLNQRVAHCRKALEKGEELRQTTCEWRYYRDSNTKILFAPDGEAIETKAMTADDIAFVESKQQGVLPGHERSDEEIEKIEEELDAMDADVVRAAGDVVDAEMPPDPEHVGDEAPPAEEANAPAAEPEVESRMTFVKPEEEPPEPGSDG